MVIHFGKEEVKLVSFSNNKIFDKTRIYQNYKNYSVILATGYKLKIHKSILFLYPSN